jgi:RNA polymerase sigma-70 factor, ECF subfamily
VEDETMIQQETETGGVGGGWAFSPAEDKTVGWAFSPSEDKTMLQQETEAELLAAAVQGNRDAYGQLVQKYQDRLLITVYRVVQNRAEAEDLCQEAFLQAYIHLRTFAGRSTFYTWLCRIALNLAISQRRRGRRSPSLDQTRQATGAEPADHGDLPADRLVREESLSQIRKALATLAPDQRAVIVLRAVDELDYQQIAEVLGLKLGTVRSRLHRARMQLRDLLQKTEAA